MRIAHLALGGCISPPPVRFGLTPDTGGHIAYIINAALAQSKVRGVADVTIVTRAFDVPGLGAEYMSPHQSITRGVNIRRLAISHYRYLGKEAISADLPELTDAFMTYLAELPTRPNVIHAHFADEAAIASTARESFGIPFVYTPHSLGLAKHSIPRMRTMLDGRIAVERQALQHADAVIVSTRDEAETQVAAYGVSGLEIRMECLPPGVPDHAMQPAESGISAWLAETLDDPAKPIILGIARPVLRKNLGALVRAYATTTGLSDKANLVIVAGQGGMGQSAEERGVLAQLRAMCSAEALVGRVALPQSHQAADVHALYAIAARGGIFVNPALHEPFGLTVIEAAAMGVPVVATRHGGPADILRITGHGLLIDPQDDGEIGAACLRLLTDRSLYSRLARAGRERAGHFSWVHYANRSVALYGSLRQPPRLLASDLDHTLTGCPEGARAFARWRGNTRLPFVVATGRSLEVACAIVAAWHLPRPDAFIVDVGTRVMLPTANGGWRECAEFASTIDRDWDRPGVAASLTALGVIPQPRHTDGPHKLSFFGTAADAATIRTTLARADLQAHVIHSHGRLIDVLAPHAGKAAAVASYAGSLGLSLADCVAAGDSGNDLDMLAACGRAIVVGNAHPELDVLEHRYGLFRASLHHAAGVIEGLTAFDLAVDPLEVAAA